MGSLEDCAAMVRDGDTIAVTGNGGGMLEPDAIFAAIEKRFLTTGHPRDLTVVHALGIGDAKTRGINRFAHKGMVKRVIGGHWSWSPRMQELAQRNEVEAFTLPSGVISLLLRESGAGRPGLITTVGLGTCYDPRNGGGAANDAAQSAGPLNEIMEIEGAEYIRYLPIKPDVAIIRGTFCDEFGNISCEEESGDLDCNAVALAACGAGGCVLAQVREERRSGQFHGRLVQVPGVMVDLVAKVPDQPQTHMGGYEPSLAGLPGAKMPAHGTFDGMSSPKGARAIIARRAADEVQIGQSVNFGFGIPGGIAAILAQQDTLDKIWVTVEQGIHNGQLIDGALFGAASLPCAIMRSTDQFDYYSSGGADVAFLGAGEVDAAGNVNVSRLGSNVVGPGGFVDISQGAKSVVFCGTFETGGLKVDILDQALEIIQPGRVAKFVDRVREVTFGGQAAAEGKKPVLYITERAVFRLTLTGIELIEIAPGADLEADILDRMSFRPLVSDDLSLMPEHCFDPDLRSPSESKSHASVGGESVG
ncbi:MAG: acyl CoA:acetate/3-ketoacid CoA transferase [Alphaproteobacteria bacterium]|nr:acyl CoA:acetate/3-ketoacid CoA transferase [Alphaproteobacteria bacterium]